MTDEKNVVPTTPRDTSGAGDPKPDLAPVGEFPEDEYYVAMLEAEEEDLKAVEDDDDLDLKKKEGSGGGGAAFGPTYSKE
jgi:hypothetical protein